MRLEWRLISDKTKLPLLGRIRLIDNKEIDMTQTNERRQFTRIDFDATAQLVQGETNLPVHLIDLSLNGVLLETPKTYTISTETPASIVITLTDDAQITMTVTLIHSSNEVLGFKCDSIDMESITLLRRLIELNIGDEHASERVLEELLKRQ